MPHSFQSFQRASSLLSALDAFTEDMNTVFMEGRELYLQCLILSRRSRQEGGCISQTAGCEMFILTEQTVNSGSGGMIYNELYEPLHSGHISSCVNTVSASPHTKSSVACHKYSVFYDTAFQYCLEERGRHKNDFPVMQSITMINIIIIICGENNTVCWVKVNSLSLRCRWHWQMGLQIGEWDKKGKH